MEHFERKITKVGNRLGITLPAKLLKKVGLTQGDHVQVEVKEKRIVLWKKEQITLPHGVDAEIMNVLNDVIKDHDQAFKGLVDR